MKDTVEVRAPAEQTEGTRSQVLRWLKAVGEHVTANEPLIEIETDKVTVEVASPGSGILRQILKHEQEEIGPSELLGVIENSTISTAAATASMTAARQVGGAPNLESERNAAAATAEPAPRSSPAHEAVVPVNAARNLSPAVRRLLDEHGLDPTSIRATGEGGRITVRDVMQAVATGGSAASSDPRIVPSSTAGTPTEVETSAAGVAQGGKIGGKSHSKPHSAVRKRIAEHMVQSLLHTAPHVTTVFEADMTAVLADRDRHREDFARKGVPLTLTAYFVRASVEAIRAVPEANSRWTDTALEIFDSIHIGVATAVENIGLVVPVLHDVESRDLFEIARDLNELVTRAREGRLSPADVRGGTFTISNHGVSGSLLATPIIINQPQSAILGIGKLEKRPVVVEDRGEDRIAIQPRCYVTLTIDHRVMDGHQANRFLGTFVHYLDSWPTPVSY